MAYNEKYEEVLKRFESKNLDAKNAAEARAQELRNKFPEVAEMDAVLSKTAIRIMNASMEGGNYQAKVQSILDEVAAINEARSAFLVENGYPGDYSDVKYECSICNDVGYVNGKMCSCLKKELAIAGYHSSGIYKLIQKENFDNFEFKYYKEKDVRENIEDIYYFSKEFAENFSRKETRNLLFIGGTGLGKTHLSTSIAKVVIDKGYDVVYETAQRVFKDYEDERFGRAQKNAEGEYPSAKYEDCDLLIIDDLGAEMQSEFNSSALYGIINTRINLEKSTIVSTNLTQKEIQERYSDRIASRFLGNYEVCFFQGEDIRKQKLNRK
ncbi:MAG: ATP-binding protein [Clostridiales bacterium]|nr:ATP-binding protein [Clostridiales bacterium]